MIERTFQNSDGTTRTEIRKQGAWRGDFEASDSTYRALYETGRLVRFENLRPASDPTKRVGLFPTPGQELWSDGKVTRHWHTYRQEPDLRRRLVREARDLDGDGVADLIVDDDRLTIEQPEP